MTNTLTHFNVTLRIYEISIGNGVELKQVGEICIAHKQVYDYQKVHNYHCPLHSFLIQRYIRTILYIYIYL